MLKPRFIRTRRHLGAEAGTEELTDEGTSNPSSQEEEDIEEEERRAADVNGDMPSHGEEAFVGPPGGSPDGRAENQENRPPGGSPDSREENQENRVVSVKDANTHRQAGKYDLVDIGMPANAGQGAGQRTRVKRSFLDHPVGKNRGRFYLQSFVSKDCT